MGFIIAGIRDLKDAKVGDTVTLVDTPAAEPLPGFKEIQPQVFAGLYPVESNRYEALRDALAKLQLNDSSLRYEPETSQALGFGFRCGFSGCCTWTSSRSASSVEYDVELITTAPTVVYQVKSRDGTVADIDNPSKLPDPSRIEEIREPIIRATIIMPQRYVGPVITLCEQKRGTQGEHAIRGAPGDPHVRHAVERDRHGFLRQAEEQFARLRVASTTSSGIPRGQPGAPDILINSDKVDALLAHRAPRDGQVPAGRELATRMRELIPRQMFDVAVQAAIGGEVVARGEHQGLAQKTSAKCYGGDITRKRKLLEKQKAGKKTDETGRECRDSTGAFLAILQVESK